MNTELFREDNTEGYTQEQMDALNAEWDKRAEEKGLEPGSSEYEREAKWFCDEVAHR